MAVTIVRIKNIGLMKNVPTSMGKLNIYGKEIDRQYEVIEALAEAAKVKNFMLCRTNEYYLDTDINGAVGDKKERLLNTLGLWYSPSEYLHAFDSIITLLDRDGDIWFHRFQDSFKKERKRVDDLLWDLRAIKGHLEDVKANRNEFRLVTLTLEV